MASIKVKYRPSTIADHEGAIYYHQIIHERKARQLNTEYHVIPDEWDENRSMVTTKQSSERKSFILSIRERIRWDVERLTKIPPTYHQVRGYQRAMCLPQHRLQYQSQFEEDSRHGRNQHPSDDVRCPPLMGQCRQSKGHPPQRNQRRHGPRQRSHHPNLPRLPRHLHR